MLRTDFLAGLGPEWSIECWRKRLISGNYRTVWILLAKEFSSESRVQKLSLAFPERHVVYDIGTALSRINTIKRLPFGVKLQDCFSGSRQRIPRQLHFHTLRRNFDHLTIGIVTTTDHKNFVPNHQLCCVHH